MKIAYLIDYDLNGNNGVIQKILQQSQKWVEAGHTVYYVSTKTLTIYDNNKNIITKLKPLNFPLGRLGTALKLFYNSFFINKLLQNIDVDIIYMRYRLYMPFFTKIVKENKVVMEINSDDTAEYALHSKLTHFYNKYSRDFLLRHIDGFVSVSKELKDRFRHLNKSIEVIANGIDISKYGISTDQHEKPILVFIGTPNQPWHGLDKIVQMAENLKDYQFYVIGTKGDDTSNIKYFGYLSQEEATDMIKRSDLGIGTLSLYKTGLNEASPLKTRQYLACGLPIIYAYEDTDLCENIDFALRLKNEEENIDYNAIRSFVGTVFNNQKIKMQAREFAEEVLDYTKKEEKRLQFFRKVLDE
jgi:glycosyltransferase involved in cell wall biosynthesis